MIVQENAVLASGAWDDSRWYQMGNRLHSHHNLTDLLVRLKIAMRGDDLRKRERLGNDGFQMAGREPLKDQVTVARKAPWVGPDR